MNSDPVTALRRLVGAVERAFRPYGAPDTMREAVVQMRLEMGDELDDMRDTIPDAEWLEVVDATEGALLVLAEADLDTLRPRRRSRGEVEETIVECDRLLSMGEVRS